MTYSLFYAENYTILSKNTLSQSAKWCHVFSALT